MALFSEIISNVANMRKQWLRSDDDSITDRQYAFIINYYRAKIVEQEANKSRYMNPNLIQDLGKVKLTRADKHDCPGGEDCIYRIERPLPKAIDTDNFDLITFVGTLNGTPFQRTTYNRSHWDVHSKYTGHLPKWYIKGDYIYIVQPPNNRFFKYINIQGVFEDPTAANEYKSCDGNDPENQCYTGFDFEYPLSLTMLDTVYKMMMEAEMKFGHILPQDKTNDTSDN